MPSASYRKLLYQYEVLRTRLEIREHYLKNVVKEVYENIGQVLSLIRVQLSSLRYDLETGRKERIDSSGELVGKTIRDLRNMCQLFYPETEIVNGPGFYQAIEQEIKALYPEAACTMGEESVVPSIIQNEKGLILFGILLEILTLITEKQKGKLHSVAIKYSKNKISIAIDYNGEEMKRDGREDPPGTYNLSIFGRTQLMEGYLQIKKTGYDLIRIKLVIPIN